MDTRDLAMVGLYFVLLVSVALPLGAYCAYVLQDRAAPFSRLEGWIYRLAGIYPPSQMSWRRYAQALLCFNGVGFLLLVALQLTQYLLPLNPQGLPAVPTWLALNTAVSFMTNSNWQAYSGEVTMSYLTQMLGLGVQNFLSAATGIAVMVALARGLSRRQSQDLGNFWVDLSRCTLYILLPLAALLAILLVAQGVPQNFSPYLQATTIEGAQQILPMGPAASQVAIKMLGSNGGGFFGANSAHPFENPTALSNYAQLFALLLLPCALVFTFGRLVNNRRHAETLVAVMFTVLLANLAIALWAESQLGAGIMEGKELRFGVASSVLWAQATTATSNGSVNAMLSSMAPLNSGLALLHILLGEVIFGGVGSGIYAMVLFVILAVFIAGLMVGRSPEYLGKKIEAAEIKLALVGVLAPGALILVGATLAVLSEAGRASLAHHGPHGLSEILYAFASAAGNNGSAFAGLNANTAFYNSLLALAMLVGRFAVIVPVLAIAGGLAQKKITPVSPGTFATEGALFGVLLVGTILIVGALTFFPALSLGPIVEHLLFAAGRRF